MGDGFTGKEGVRTWGLEIVLLFWYSPKREGCGHTAGKCAPARLSLSPEVRNKRHSVPTGAGSVSLAPGFSWTLLPSCLAEAAGSSWRCLLPELDLTWAKRPCVRR